MQNNFIRTIIVASTFLFSTSLFANPYDFRVTRVIDGDTVEFEAPFLPAPLPPKLSIRVLGDVIVDGQRLSQLLIQYGHARPYFREKKGSWCN